MQTYQEEYLHNLEELYALSRRKPLDGRTPEAYFAALAQDQARTETLILRNMDLLRSQLFPQLDDLFHAGREDLDHLFQFASRLLVPGKELDPGLFCQIHRALLSLARQKQDRSAMIRELYWLGIGRNSLYGRLVGLDFSLTEKYVNRMRLCFTEAAAYLKYFDELSDDETRGYILRSRANMSLGTFKHPREKIHMVKTTQEILNDQEYQKKAPALPWDRYIYMTHQQMAASISYAKDHDMTPEDVEAVMESSYIVFQRRLHEAEANRQRLSNRWALPYHTTEFYCGVLTLDQLLHQLEALMDHADLSDYSPDSCYTVISMPAFYCQYLQHYPDRIAGRETYLDILYRRILRYVEAFPKDLEGDVLFRYLCQLSHTFIEIANGLLYRDFLLKLLVRFAPQLYIHAAKVAWAAKAFCQLILSHEPDFFDDIPEFQVMPENAEKQQAILDYAAGCGLFHDIGEVNMLELFAHIGRQWMAEEEQVAQMHTDAGKNLLAPRASTSRYADAALGHHAWYDGLRGYPAAYQRLECPSRQMVDVIGLVDWLENLTGSAWLYTGESMTFDQAINAAIELEGKRFSPLLTAWLREGGAECIQSAFEQGLQAARRRLYEDSLRSLDAALP